MAVPSSSLPKALDDLSGREHVADAVILSTCHRTEVYVDADRYHGAVQDVRNFLGEVGFLPPEDFSDGLYAYHDDAAVAHLFAVACGLDSVVLGESEILAQVKNAWERAREEGYSGPSLSALFRHALEVGKRARSETAIGRHVTSLSQAAVSMAADRLGDLPGVTLLDLDDLRSFAEAGRDRRRQEVSRVRGIVADEVARFLDRESARAVAPAISALRERAERVRADEVARFRGRLQGLDE